MSHPIRIFGPAPGIDAETQFFGVELLALPRVPFAELFERHFHAIRTLRETAQSAGWVGIALFGPDQVAGAACVYRHLGLGWSSLIVGRHHRCRLRLEQDPTLPLRHLLVHATQGGDGGELRVLDLNSGQGFDVEGLGRCQAVASTGPLFLRLGGYALMFFPVHPQQPDWSRSAHVAWQELPPVEVHRRAGRRRRHGRVVDPELVTQLTELPPIAELSATPIGIGAPVATVAMLDGGEWTHRPLWREDLDRGVLVGRYERCDLRSTRAWCNEAVSRVHLLLLADGDDVLAIDTGSLNGTRLEGRPLVAERLPASAELSLAKVLQLRWENLVENGEPARAAESARPAGPLAPRSPRPPRHAPWTWPIRLYLRLGIPIAMLLFAGATFVGTRLIMEELAELQESVWEPKPQPEPTPARVCIHPINDLGTDSPALRLYLYQQDPDVCFDYKWTPRVQEYLDGLREGPP